MRRNRTFGWGAAGIAVTAVLLTAGCGGKDVTFTPAADTGSIVPSSTAGAAGTTGSSTSSGSSPAVTTPPNVVISTQGTSVCVKNKDTGSQACVSSHGTAVVDGLVIVDGKLVSGTGSSGDGNVVIGGSTPPVPTSGTVALTGATSWSGTATGTCRRTGDVRTADVALGGGGRLVIDAVGGGVVRIEVTSGGTSYSGNWVGDSGVVTLSDASLTVNGAPVGRGDRTVKVTATLNC